jgi:hypothetical protein
MEVPTCDLRSFSEGASGVHVRKPVAIAILLDASFRQRRYIRFEWYHYRVRVQGWREFAGELEHLTRTKGR